MKGTEAADMAGASMGATSDNAPWQGCVVGQHSKVNGGNSDTKTAATAIAKAACLGIECHLICVDTWLLRHAHGADIGVLHGVSALVAAVGGFEAANNDVRYLVQRMRGGNHG